jgi:hypothetical protein
MPTKKCEVLCEGPCEQEQGYTYAHASSRLDKTCRRISSKLQATLQSLVMVEYSVQDHTILYKPRIFV